MVIGINLIQTYCTGVRDKLLVIHRKLDAFVGNLKRKASFIK